MCVTVGVTAPNRGPVTVAGGAGQALVRVGDIAYRLGTGRPAGRVVFTARWIDGFFAPYQWHGNQLQFNDTEKSTLATELKLGQPRRLDGL